MKVRKKIDTQNNRVLLAFYEKKIVQSYMHILVKEYADIQFDRMEMCYTCFNKGSKYEMTYDNHQAMDWRLLEKEEARQLWTMAMEGGFRVKRQGMPWNKEEPLTEKEKMYHKEHNRHIQWAQKNVRAWNGKVVNP